MSLLSFVRLYLRRGWSLGWPSRVSLITMLAYTIWWISGWFRHHSAQETIIVVTVFFVLVGGSFVAAEIRLRRRKRQVDADLKQRLAKLEVILTQPESEWPPDYLEERAIAYARHVLNDKEPNG